MLNKQKDAFEKFLKMKEGKKRKKVMEENERMRGERKKYWNKKKFLSEKRCIWKKKKMPLKVRKMGIKDMKK